MILSLALLAGCPGKPPDDTAETGDSAHSGETAETGDTTETDDTDDTGAAARSSLSEADASFVGGPSQAAGASLAILPDLNGDGLAETVVGAYYGNTVCVFLSPVEPGRSDLADADTCWTGEGTYDFASYGLASVGDADGDGAPDLLVGSVGNGQAGTNAGKIYLASGAVGPGRFLLADATAAWVGEASGDYAGIALTRAGDVTGDGAADFLVGAAGNDGGGAGGGKAYLLPGPLQAGTFLLSEQATSFYGGASSSVAPPPHGSLGSGDLVGDALAGPGDVDGDGVDDLALGAGGNQKYGANTGMAVVYFGPVAVASHSIYDADLRLYGPRADAYAGSPVVAVGDLSGDGRGDLLVAADGVDSGTMYLVSPAGMSGDVELVDTPVSFVGELAGDQAGASAAALGDVNGDAEPDLAIGAPASDRAGLDAGAVYLLHGPFAAGVHPLADAAEILAGEVTADSAARALAGGADLSGDGVPDLLVGAIYNDDGGAFSGKAYLVQGR